MQRTMKHWNRLGECVNTKTKNAGQQPLSELKANYEKLTANNTHKLLPLLTERLVTNQNQ